MDANKIGKTISFLRLQYGMTQLELAGHLGVTDKAVSRWERGQGIPDVSLLTKLSLTLGTDIESILEGDVTQLGMHWKGLLYLDYPKGIHAYTNIYSKCSIYLQLSYFMLAGIKEISVIGLNEDINFTQQKLRDGKELGISLSYTIIDNIPHNSISGMIAEIQNCGNMDGVMFINGLDMIYGKDVTKRMRILMHTSESCVHLHNYMKQPLSLHLFPKNASGMAEHKSFDRGVVAYPINNLHALQSASNLIAGMEQQTQEQIADLKEIAQNRGYIC